MLAIAALRGGHDHGDGFRSDKSARARRAADVPGGLRHRRLDWTGAGLAAERAHAHSPSGRSGGALVGVGAVAVASVLPLRAWSSGALGVLVAAVGVAAGYAGQHVRLAWP